MDLYLMSPVFLKKLMRKQTVAPSDVLEEKDLDVDDILQDREESESESDSEIENRTRYQQRDVRRRSSLDRMLRQHAYIIICILGYACTLPGQGS